MKNPEITNANITKYSVAFFRKLQDFSCVVESIAGTSFDAAESGPQAHNFMNHSL